MARTATAQSANGTAKIIKTSGDAMTDDVKELKADLTALRADVKSLLTDAGELLKAKADQGVDSGKKLAQKAGNDAVEAKTYAEDKIRSNPLAAVGIAFGVGIVLASLRRK